MSMRAFATTIMALTVSVIARPAAGQSERLARRLDSATNAAVTAALDSARQQGLPLEPLVDRALEGASKNASGALIVAAVRRLAHDLGAARRALGDASQPTELEAGASALRAGADSSVLARLRRARPRHTVTVPLAVMTDLIARGIPADSAARFVLAVASATDEQYVTFQRNVERDIALGAPPIAAAAVRMSAPTAVGDASSPPAAPSPPRRP
jgi:hypothetical protein